MSIARLEGIRFLGFVSSCCLVVCLIVGCPAVAMVCASLRAVGYDQSEHSEYGALLGKSIDRMGFRLGVTKGPRAALSKLLIVSSPVVMLSKSDYRAGLDCLKKVWLKKHRPDLKAPLDAGAQKRLDDGNEVGLLARRLFPKGVLMPSGDVQETLRAIENGAETLFEASFEAEGFRCRADASWRRL